MKGMRFPVFSLMMAALMCLVGFADAKDRPIDELPMYGGKQPLASGQNREASESAARLGWQLYYKGEMDPAMKRFNQAWMMDRDSVDALWGFGLIMGQRAARENPEHNLRESIRFLNMANEKANRNVRIMTDMAFVHTLLGRHLKTVGKPGSSDAFLSAEKILSTALEIDGKYPLAHFTGSVLEFYKGNYPEAQKRLLAARTLGFKPDPAYVQELALKLKQPPSSAP